MKQVTIHRCPVSPAIRDHTEGVVAALQGEAGVQVTVLDGAAGEFVVEVEDREVGRSGGWLPDIHEVVMAVHGGVPAGF